MQIRPLLQTGLLLAGGTGMVAAQAGTEVNNVDHCVERVVTVDEKNHSRVLEDKTHFVEKKTGRSLGTTAQPLSDFTDKFETCSDTGKTINPVTPKGEAPMNKPEVESPSTVGALPKSKVFQNTAAALAARGHKIQVRV